MHDLGALEVPEEDEGAGQPSLWTFLYSIPDICLQIYFSIEPFMPRSEWRFYAVSASKAINIQA